MGEPGTEQGLSPAFQGARRPTRHSLEGPR